MYFNVYQVLIMGLQYQINVIPEFEFTVSAGDKQMRDVRNAKTRKDFTGYFGGTYEDLGSGKNV